MKRSVLLLAACALLSVPAASFSQMNIKFRGTGGWGITDRYEQLFMNASQETVVGQIMAIDTVTPLRDMAQGIMLILRTEREDVVVHLGPAWYILYQDMSLSVKDKNIEVRGYRAMIDGKQVIMASTLVRRDRVLLMRDRDGIPYWCGWRPRMN
jgi:hypothetical protein